jgi:hypothetical protein
LDFEGLCVQLHVEPVNSRDDACNQSPMPNSHVAAHRPCFLEFTDETTGSVVYKVWTPVVTGAQERSGHYERRAAVLDDDSVLPCVVGDNVPRDAHGTAMQCAVAWKRKLRDEHDLAEAGVPHATRAARSGQSGFCIKLRSFISAFRGSGARGRAGGAGRTNCGRRILRFLNSVLSPLYELE